VLPLALWCAIAYLPIWDSEVRITLSSDTQDDAFSTVFVPGDQMAVERFAAFQEAVRQDNVSPMPGQTPAATRRANKRVLRGLAPVAIAEGWLTADEEKDYAALYTVWKGVAEGNMKGGLSEENTVIAAKNWEALRAVSPTYDSGSFLSEPLLKLIPQGQSEVKRPSFLPGPHEIVMRAWEDFRGESELGDLGVWQRYGVSIRTIALGFLCVCAVGIPIALLCGTFAFFSRLIEPFVDFFRYMPAPAFGTLLIALFGIYDAPKVALVFLGTLPQLILMVANTTRMLDPALLDAAQTLGANRRQLITRVVIPGILPNLYNDLRILLGWAWTWLVIAELLGVKAGLTEIIDTQGRRFHFDHVYPIILLIGLTGFLTDQFLSWFRGVIFPYTEEGASASARSAARFLSKVNPLRRRRAYHAKAVPASF
jgi:NitT/TauT family transport system permease protein